VVLPFLNVTTSPFGGAVPVELIVAAVKVIACPRLLGFAEDVIVVVVATLFTTCFKAGDVLELKFASPVYTAVMLYEPKAKEEMV
jgi:hypothetical protein